MSYFSPATCTDIIGTILRLGPLNLFLFIDRLIGIIICVILSLKTDLRENFEFKTHRLIAKQLYLVLCIEMLPHNPVNVHIAVGIVAIKLQEINGELSDFL